MCQCDLLASAGAADFPVLADFHKAAIRLSPYVQRTPFELCSRLSQVHGQKVFFKREDQQVVRSFKVRGALNKMLTLDKNQKNQGVVCASAGNHAQGFAFACRLLNVQGVVFLPQNTTKQKVDQVRYFGGQWVKVVLSGMNFDQSYRESRIYSQQTQKTYVHPFDDAAVIAGQGTVALEMIANSASKLDCVLLPVGGGGLASGIAAVFKQLSPATKVIGVEVAGSTAMFQSLQRQARLTLSELDLFADGTAVQQVGELPFRMCRALLDDVIVVSKKSVCQVLFELNNVHGMIVEPSGALAVAALANKAVRGYERVACVISGGNNDARRFVEYSQILQASLLSHK